jgi:hypothetical protein
VVFGALLAVLTATGPERLESAPRLCLFRFITGRVCWACGITRAVASALRGNLVAAWHYNKLVAVVLPLIASLAAKDAFTVWSDRRRPKRGSHRARRRVGAD